MIEKRKITELIALYKLEESLIDIYVEGLADKSVYQNFVVVKSLGPKLILIDTLDFADIDIKYLLKLDASSNKDKVILLSRVLIDFKSKAKIACIADKDIDPFTIGLEENKFLWRTDFSCLESYFFNEAILEKFIQFCFTNFPHPPKHILTQLGDLLKLFYVLRIVRFSTVKSFKLPDITKACQINKKTGELTFNKKTILDNFYSQNKIKDRTGYDDQIENTYLKINNFDLRDTINGHDFFNLLYTFLNCIKNTGNYKESNFDKTFFLSAEGGHLEKFGLFQKISSF